MVARNTVNDPDVVQSCAYVAGVIMEFKLSDSLSDKNNAWSAPRPKSVF